MLGSWYDSLLKKIDQFKHQVVHLVVERPKTSIFLAIIPALILIPFIVRLEQNFGVRMWFRTTDPNLKTLDQFERQFGNDQAVLVGIKAADGVFTPSNMKLVMDLTEEAWKKTDVIRVESLTNTNVVKAVGDELRVDPFIPNDSPLHDETFLKQKQTFAVKDHNILNRFVDKEAKVALLYAHLVPRLDGKESNYRLITSEFATMLDKYKRPGIEFILLGSAPLNDAFRAAAQHDISLLTPISFFIIGLILFIVLKTWVGVLSAMGAVFIVILSCFGLAALTGIQYNNLVSAIPAIILAICLAEIMHVLVVYYRYCDEGYSRKEAMFESLHKNFYATFLTAITTAFGFVGDMATELTPISHLGFLSSYGTMAAWCMTIFFIAPLVMLFPYSPKDRSKFFDVKLFKSPERFVDTIDRHHGKIVFLVCALTALSLYFASKVEVNAAPFTYFKKNNPVRSGNDFMLKTFNGLGGPQIVIESGEEGGINSPDFLKKVDQFESWIESQKYVNQVISILDVMKDLNQNLHQGDPAFFRIPEKRKEVAEQLFLYSLSLPSGMDLNNLMTVDQRDIRMNVFWSITDSKTSLNEIERISEYGKSLGLNLYVSGKLFLYDRMNDYVVDTFNQSNMIALSLIGAVMMLIFRSFKLGIISLIPNVIPLVYGLGLLGATYGYLDIGTSLVTSVCLGITVDDTIHFLLHYSDLRRRGVSLRDALIEIYDITAPSLIFTTLLLVFGFGVFILGDFVPNVYFGVLCAIILTLGVFLDLYFLPALMFMIEKREGTKS